MHQLAIQHGVHVSAVRQCRLRVAIAYERIVRARCQQLFEATTQRLPWVLLRWLWDESDQKLAIEHEESGKAVLSSYCVLVQRGALRLPNDVLNRPLPCRLRALATQSTSCLNRGLVEGMPFDARKSWITDLVLWLILIFGRDDASTNRRWTEYQKIVKAANVFLTDAPCDSHATHLTNISVFLTVDLQCGSNIISNMIRGVHIMNIGVDAIKMLDGVCAWAKSVIFITDLPPEHDYTESNRLLLDFMFSVHEPSSAQRRCAERLLVLYRCNWKGRRMCHNCYAGCECGGRIAILVSITVPLVIGLLFPARPPVPCKSRWTGKPQCLAFFLLLSLFSQALSCVTAELKPEWSHLSTGSDRAQCAIDAEAIAEAEDAEALNAEGVEDEDKRNKRVLQSRRKKHFVWVTWRRSVGDAFPAVAEQLAIAIVGIMPLVQVYPALLRAQDNAAETEVLQALQQRSGIPSETFDGLLQDLCCAQGTRK